MSAYRFSWLRPNGWTRLGGLGAVVALFSTPMLWAVGVFGVGEDALRRALIFLFAGMWLCVGAGWMLGWVLRGFMVRLKEEDDDDRAGPAHRAAPPAHAPHPPAAAHRPGR